MPSSFLPRGVVPAALLTSFVLVACGARGPLDITVIEEVPGDASSDAAIVVEAATDASDASEVGPADTGAPGFDGGPLINCGTCLAQTCGTQLLTCLESTDCRTALQCVATTCLTGGTPDLSCIEGCASGDVSALGDLIGAFTCVLENCSSCTSVLGGLGGLGGGGGGTGGGGGSADGGG